MLPHSVQKDFTVNTMNKRPGDITLAKWLRQALAELEVELNCDLLYFDYKPGIMYTDKFKAGKLITDVIKHLEARE